jgi:hypothetical protein
MIVRMLAADAGAGTATLHSKAVATSANLVLIDVPPQLREMAGPLPQSRFDQCAHHSREALQAK